MTQKNSSANEFQGRHLVIWTFALLAFGIIWMFYPGDMLSNALQKNWQTIFGVAWHEDSQWRSIPILTLTKFSPTFIAGAFAWLLITRVERQNFSKVHRDNLEQLEKARNALKQGISSLESIEIEYRSKLADVEKLRTDLDALRSMKSADADELRRRISAIEQANRWNRRTQQAFGFVLGVLSSLVATYLWERIGAI